MYYIATQNLHTPYAYKNHHRMLLMVSRQDYTSRNHKLLSVTAKGESNHKTPWIGECECMDCELGLLLPIMSINELALLHRTSTIASCRVKGLREKLIRVYREGPYFTEFYVKFKELYSKLNVRIF